MEIEQRAFIRDIAGFRKKVEGLGAKFHSESHIIDYWFCRKEFNAFDQVKQDKPGSYGLRIRVQKFKDSERAEINAKVLEKELDHNAFHEHETEVKDPVQMRNILESIGFKNFCIVDKKRTTYELGECKINIEDIKGYKPAVELEIIADSDQEKHKETMKKMLSDLGIHKEDMIEKSITFLYMKEFSFK